MSLFSDRPKKNNLPQYGGSGRVGFGSRLNRHVQLVDSLFPTSPKKGVSFVGLQVCLGQRPEHGDVSSRDRHGQRIVLPTARRLTQWIHALLPWSFAMTSAPHLFKSLALRPSRCRASAARPFVGVNVVRPEKSAPRTADCTKPP